MIKYDNGHLELLTSDAGEELMELLLMMKGALPKQEFLKAVTVALMWEVPEGAVRKMKEETVREPKINKNINELLNELERRRASKNKSAANKRKSKKNSV